MTTRALNLLTLRIIRVDSGMSNFVCSSSANCIRLNLQAKTSLDRKAVIELRQKCPAVEHNAPKWTQGDQRLFPIFISFHRLICLFLFVFSQLLELDALLDQDVNLNHFMQPHRLVTHFKVHQISLSNTDKAQAQTTWEPLSHEVWLLIFEFHHRHTTSVFNSIKKGGNLF